MKKTIITLFSIFFIFGCQQKATDKINNTSNTEDQINTNEEKNLKPENNINPEVVFNNGEGGAKIEFDMKEWDFGQIIQGESVDTVFKFKNIGDQPLIISNAKGSCGCTVPQWPKDPIPPGENGEIAVKFNSKGKSGKTQKKVTLTMNTTPNTMYLRVAGEIIVPEK